MVVKEEHLDVVIWCAGCHGSCMVLCCDVCFLPSSSIGLCDIGEIDINVARSFAMCVFGRNGGVCGCELVFFSG